VLGACASAAVVSSRRLFNWLVVERAVHGAWCMGVKMARDGAVCGA
jgi:hypothetical protein